MLRVCSIFFAQSVILRDCTAVLLQLLLLLDYIKKKDSGSIVVYELFSRETARHNALV
jgi:hypothetical protein